MNDRPEARNLGNQEAMDALIEALMVVGGTVLLARLVVEDRAMKLW